MSADSYAAAGYERRRGAVDRRYVDEAKLWIDQHRNDPDIPATRDVFDRRQPGPIKLRRLWQADPTFWTEFVVRSGILPLAEEHLGTDCLLIRSACFIKYPRSQAEVGWHRDVDLWGHSVRAGATLWVPLTSSSEVAGALRFIPKSHQLPPGPLRFDPQHPYHRVMDISSLPTAVACPAEPGDCIVMHAATAHASGRNDTGDERVALVLAFACCNKEDLVESAIRFRGAQAEVVEWKG